MVETKKTPQSNEYTVIYTANSDTENRTYKAVGTYKSEEEAYAAAIVSQLQVIEHVSKTWPKAVLIDKQEHVAELCQKLKQDFTTYRDRFAFLKSQCSQLFQDLLDSQYHVLAINTTHKPQIDNESIFKTKLRNFLDVFQTRTDIEEDLDNSDDDEDEEDDDEEEVEEDSDIEGSAREEDEEIEGEDEDEEGEEEDSMAEEEEEEDEEQHSNTNTVPEATEDELEEEEENSGLKRDASALDEEDDEEDEIEEDNDEDNDQDELEEEDATSKKRRIVS